jgi:hypothetical protein
MKYISLSLVLFLIGFTTVNTKQQKYLPVYISILDTSNIPPSLLLNLKAVFEARKIKTLSKKDVESLIYNESYSVTQDYLRTGGDLRDLDKWKNHQATNMQSIGNNLALNIKIDADGFINDTVKWDSRTIPVNMVHPHKANWRYMILDSINAKTMLQMSQSIVDSIIASNVLIKE